MTKIKTDEELRDEAQKLIDSIAPEKFECLENKIKRVFQERKLLECNGSCKCSICNENILCGCLQKEFKHCYCQGILNGSLIPSKLAKDSGLFGVTSNIPPKRLCRLSLRLMAKDSLSSNPKYSIEDVIISILAWGGKTVKRQIGNWSISLPHNLTTIKHDLSVNPFVYRETLLSILDTKGIGISYASKILFFYDFNYETAILDDRVNKSLICLFGKNFILGGNSTYSKTRQLNLYFLYIQILKILSVKFSLTPIELLEILFW